MNLLVYGTLRRFHHNHIAMGLADASNFIREVRVPNFSLYDLLRGFPAAVAEPNPTGVLCELFNITDHNIMRYLDQYEGFDPSSLKDSLYVRKSIALSNGEEAQIYVFNKSLPQEAILIPDGDWRNYQ